MYHVAAKLWVYAFGCVEGPGASLEAGIIRTTFS